MPPRKAELITELVDLYHKNPAQITSYDFRILATLAVHCLDVVISRQNQEPVHQK